MLDQFGREIANPIEKRLTDLEEAVKVISEIVVRMQRVMVTLLNKTEENDSGLQHITTGNE